MTPAERFAAKVKPNLACLEWQGATSRGGYGRFWTGTRHMTAHRYAYEQAFGPIPEGKWVLHHCDNPPCVAVDHLFLGTPLDNAQDMDAKGRRVIPARVGKRAETTHLAKLTWDDVRDIRTWYRVGVAQTELAAAYDVSYSTIHRIVNPSPGERDGLWQTDGERFALAVELGVA